MIIDIILGNNIDTKIWINELLRNGADHIIVINYDYNKEVEEKNGILYMSPNYAQNYIKKFDSLNFYKSLYAYPGMRGNMSSLYKKDQR